MTIDEAKSILQAYRAGSPDAKDPTFAAALALAEAEPELRTWLARQVAFDHEISEQLAHIAPPPGLRESLLAQGLSERGAPVGEELPTASRFSRPVWLAATAAAAAVALAAVFATTRGMPAAESPLAAFAIEDAQDPRKHGGKGDEAKQLNRTLNTLETRLGDPLPVNFESLHESGCRTVQVDGRQVLEMCFRRDKVQFHCYIARRADFPRLRASEEPQIVERNGAGLATWIEGENLYLVVSKPGPEPLEKLL